MANTLQKNSRQEPGQAILDYYNRQTYLENSFVYGQAGFSVSGTSETNLLLISNPAANFSPPSSFKAQNIGLFLGYRKLICETASQTALLNFYLNPTVTGAGTPQTPVNARLASSQTSLMSIATAPTTSSKGTYIDSLFSGGQVNSISELLLILDPGSSLLVTATVSQTATNIVYQMAWYEL
jgi:hypothetical protein